MEDDKIVKIDIDKVLQSKMGAKSKFVPRFICNWLKHIVHQEEINAFLEGVGGKQGLPWLDAVMDFLDDKIEILGLENLPDDEGGRRYTFVSNHP